MLKRPQAPPPRDRPRLSRARGVGMGLIGLASLALVLSACGASSLTTTTTVGSSPPNASGGSNSGAGPVTRPGSDGGSGSAGEETSGSWSAAFAQCMRSQGVLKFPNPNGSPIPGGVNPASPAYQAALNGPCKSLAPAGWVSSGRVTK
jgi:hypothetical protein